MDKAVSVRTLIAFVSAIGIPILIFLYTLLIKTDRNESRSIHNQNEIEEILSFQKERRYESNTNFTRVMDKLHEIDLKLKDKANRK